MATAIGPPTATTRRRAYQWDLHAIVQELGLREIVLIGLSMGGRNAFTYASSHPERVRALVIVDAAPESRPAGTENIRRFVQQEDELDSVDDFVKRVQAYNPRRSVQQIRGSILNNLKQLPSGRWTWKYDKLLRSPGRRLGGDPATERRLWGYVEGLQCPTLVVTRGRDRRRSGGYGPLDAAANPGRPARHGRGGGTPGDGGQSRRLRKGDNLLPVQPSVTPPQV